jgi:hypothetical protein
MLLSIIQLSGDKGSANRAKSKEKNNFLLLFRAKVLLLFPADNVFPSRRNGGNGRNDE